MVHDGDDDDGEVCHKKENCYRVLEKTCDCVYIYLRHAWGQNFENWVFLHRCCHISD